MFLISLNISLSLFIVCEKFSVTSSMRHLIVLIIVNIYTAFSYLNPAQSNQLSQVIAQVCWGVICIYCWESLHFSQGEVQIFLKPTNALQWNPDEAAGNIPAQGQWACSLITMKHRTLLQSLPQPTETKQMQGYAWRVTFTRCLVVELRRLLLIDLVLCSSVQHRVERSLHFFWRRNK